MKPSVTYPNALCALLYVYPVECIRISYSTGAPCALSKFMSMTDKTDKNAEDVIKSVRKVIHRYRNGDR